MATRPRESSIFRRNSLNLGRRQRGLNSINEHRDGDGEDANEQEEVRVELNDDQAPPLIYDLGRRPFPAFLFLTSSPHLSTPVHLKVAKLCRSCSCLHVSHPCSTCPMDTRMKLKTMQKKKKRKRKRKKKKKKTSMRALRRRHTKARRQGG